RPFLFRFLRRKQQADGEADHLVEMAEDHGGLPVCLSSDFRGGSPRARLQLAPCCSRACWPPARRHPFRWWRGRAATARIHPRSGFAPVGASLARALAAPSLAASAWPQLSATASSPRRAVPALAAVRARPTGRTARARRE